MTVIKGLIFKQNDAEYFYTGMRSELRGFLNLHQGEMLATEYHIRWTARGNIAEEFGDKVGNSEQ